MTAELEITEEMLKGVAFEANLDQLALVLYHECRHQAESGKGIARIREELVKMYESGRMGAKRQEERNINALLWFCFTFVIGICILGFLKSLTIDYQLLPIRSTGITLSQ